MASETRVQWVSTGKKLGQGATGVVTLGTFVDGSSSTLVAIKSATGRKADVLRREYDILNLLQDGCREIIKCYGGANSRESAVDQHVTFNIFLDYVQEGSLEGFLKTSPMYECYARRFTRSILRGLAHIHRRQIVHCDIKPANLLLWDEEEIRIADFGHAMRQGEENRWKPCRGTPYYIAPECVSRNEYGPPADVWSLGCTVAEMLTSRPARGYLGVISRDELLHLIATGGAMPEIPYEMSEMGKDFLARCFKVDPKKRWTAEMLLQHPFAADDDVKGKSSSDSAWRERVSQICVAHSSPAQEESDKSANLRRPQPADHFDMGKENPFDFDIFSPRAQDESNKSANLHPPMPPQFDMWKEDLFEFGISRLKI